MQIKFYIQIELFRDFSPKKILSRHYFFISNKILVSDLSMIVFDIIASEYCQ